MYALFLALMLAAGYGHASGTCADKYLHASSTHSQCIDTTGPGLVSAEPPTSSEIDLIVATHNDIRSGVGATNMMRMKWDDEIASSAQKKASMCMPGHDSNAERREPGKYSVGQNIAYGGVGYFSDWEAVVRYWATEVQYFNADRTYSSEAGHYSAIVWAPTSLVGCGKAVCDMDGWNYELFYCNYAPGGNFPNVEAYNVDGEACSQCGSARCTDNLCDCGSDNKLNGCYNMGTLNLETCACSCREDFYDAADLCALNTCPASDPSVCVYYPGQYCALMANLPVDCPIKCETCPYAAADYSG